MWCIVSLASGDSRNPGIVNADTIIDTFDAIIDTYEMPTVTFMTCVLCAG